MANAFSDLHNYRQELIGPNYQLIATALQSKQGRLDANRAKLQAIADTIPSLDIAKGVDKEYTEKRFETAMDIVNKYSSGDLSDSSMSRELNSKLQEVVDDDVETAIVSTALYRSEQAAWQKLQKDNRELYAEHNHRFANQNANMWLSDETVGKSYRGGGGVIEYRDLGRKVLDNLPEIQKNILEGTGRDVRWVYPKSDEGEGYFVYSETSERVERGVLQNAMGLLFDDKDRQQMGINAWEQYSRMSPEDLEATYTEYYQPRIDSAEEVLDNYKSAREQETSNNKKAEYDQVIKRLERNLEDLKGGSYKNVTAVGGESAAYNKLYQDKFNSNILDMYAIAPRVIERKVDEVSKANREYELRVLESQRKAAQDAETKRHNLAQESGKNGNGSGNGSPSLRKGGDVNVGKPSEVTPGKYIIDHYAKVDASRTTMEELMVENGLTSEDLTSKDFVNQVKNLANKEYITIKGKKIPIGEGHEGNLRKILNYKDKYMTTSPEMVEVFKNMDSMLESIGKQIKVSTNSSGVIQFRSTFGEKFADMKYSELPNFNFRFVKGKGGKLKYEFIPRSDDTHNYGYLLKHGAKTEGGKLTLKLYESLHLLNDPSLTESQRRITQDYVNNILSGLPKSEASKINTEIVNTKGERLKNSHSVVPNLTMQDFFLSQFTRSDTEKAFISRVEVGEDSNKDDYKNYTGSATQGLDDLMKIGFENIGKGLTNEYGREENRIAEANFFVADYGTEDYETYKRFANVLDPDYKYGVKVELEFMDAEPTGKIVITPQVETTKAERDTAAEDGKSLGKTKDGEPVTVSASELSGEVDLPFDYSRKEFTYNAGVSSRAKTLELGNNIYTDADGNRTKNFYDPSGRENNNPVILTNEVIVGLVENAESRYKDRPEIANQIKEELNNYLAGEYNFSLVPKDDKMYHVRVQKSGSNTYVDTPFTLTNSNGTTSVSDITNMKEQILLDPREQIERAFIIYLEDVENKMKLDSSVRTNS